MKASKLPRTIEQMATDTVATIDPAALRAYIVARRTAQAKSFAKLKDLAIYRASRGRCSTNGRDAHESRIQAQARDLLANVMKKAVDGGYK